MKSDWITLGELHGIRSWNRSRINRSAALLIPVDRREIWCERSSIHQSSVFTEDFQPNPQLPAISMEKRGDFWARPRLISAAYTAQTMPSACFARWFRCPRSLLSLHTTSFWAARLNWGNTELPSTCSTKCVNGASRWICAQWASQSIAAAFYIEWS